MDDLKLVYPCKSVTGIEIDKENFDEMLGFCFESEVKQNKTPEAEQEKTEIKKMATQKTINLKLNNKLISFCIIGFALLCVIVFLLSNTSNNIEGRISPQHSGIVFGGDSPYLKGKLMVS